MQDIHTQNSQLRLTVQWALGRVSNDEEVVDALLNNMQNDPNPLFRDKSACALASDQIHLSEEQKVHLLEGLIQALSDPKPQVRNIAIKALKVQTGQTKGFNPKAPARDRESIIREWQSWLKRVQIKYIIVFIISILLTLTANALDSSNILVSYSFDDDNISTGPDTFAVFERGDGIVALSPTYRFSGYYSIEIRDISHDWDFPGAPRIF